MRIYENDVWIRTQKLFACDNFFKTDYAILIGVILLITDLLQIFPDVTRDIGSGLGNVFLFALTIVAIKMNPFLLKTLGIQMLLSMYACLLLPCIIILYFVMPETRGHTLLQIEKSFEHL